MSDRYTSYEQELNLLLTEISTALEDAAIQSGEKRRATVSSAERSIDEAKELVGSLELEIQQVPTSQRSAPTQKIRGYKVRLDSQKRELRQIKELAQRNDLLGNRGTSEGSEDGAAFEQRNRLLSGTDRLEQSSSRLQSSQRIAHETESIGAGILSDLHAQREQITNTRDRLMQADGYVDKSMKSLKSMGRRMITNKIITGSIIAILIMLILLVIYSKFK